MVYRSYVQHEFLNKRCGSLQNNWPPLLFAVEQVRI